MAAGAVGKKDPGKKTRPAVILPFSLIKDVILLAICIAIYYLCRDTNHFSD